jgi:hypothetical protein
MAKSFVSAILRMGQRAYARGIKLLTADEITRLSWARRVDSWASVPVDYHPYLEAHLPAQMPFPGGILTPTYQGFLRQENERLILRLGDCLHILERRKEGIVAAVFPLHEIDFVEQGAVLLRAWLSLSGCNAEGHLQQATLRYNTVTEHMFFPLINAVRQLAGAEPAGAPSISPQTQDAIDALEPFSLKFRNYARRSLLPGEQIMVSIFQPEIRRPRLPFRTSGWLYRRLCPTHLCLWTTSELILISDDPDVPRALDQQPHGGIWTYLPRRRVTGANLELASEGCLRLHITLSGGSTLETLFASQHQEELEQIVQDISLSKVPIFT